MKVTHNRQSKIIKFLNGRTFYVVLCLCFIAIGVAMWTGVESIKNITNENLNNGSTTLDNTSQHHIEILPNIDSSSTTSIESSPPKDTESKPVEEASTNVAMFFIRPLLGDITKKYSDSELQYSMTFNDMRLHKGIDISGELGDPVMSCGSGTVTEVYYDSMYGWVVKIDHGNKINAKYCGLASAPTVKINDVVDSSKQIGTLGDMPCESVEPTHLHLEFTQNGKSTDPLKFFVIK